MDSPRPSYWPTVLLVLVGAWMIIYNVRPIQDPDIWWHLASGRYMVTHHEIPSVDVFSLTARGTAWVNSYWMFDVLAYRVFQAGGITGIILANAAFLAVFSLALIHLMLPTASWSSRLWASVWIFLGSHPRGFGAGEKASYVTLFFLGLLFLSLYYLKDQEKEDLLPFWPLAFLVWANMHRGFLLGLGVFGIYVAGLWLSRRKEALKLSAVLLVSFAITFINPFNWRLYGMGWQDVSLSPVHVTGWGHTPFAHLEIFWVTMGLYWAVWLERIFRKQFPGWAHFATGLLFSALSLRYASFYPYFMIWSVPWMIRVFQQNATFSKRSGYAVVALVALAMASFQHRPRLGINRSIFPVDATAFLQANQIEGALFHEYELGGFYMWTLAGQPPVLIDGRYPAVEGYRRLYPEIEERTQSDPKEFQRFLTQYTIETAAVKYPSTLYMPSPYQQYFPRTEWALSYWDDTLLVFLKRGTPTQKRLAALEFASLDPEADPQYWLNTIWKPANADKKKRIQGELERNLALHPNSRRTRRWLEWTGRLI